MLALMSNLPDGIRAKFSFFVARPRRKKRHIKRIRHMRADRFFSDYAKGQWINCSTDCLVADRHNAEVLSQKNFAYAIRFSQT